MNSIKDLLLGEPSTVSRITIEKLLEEDFRLVLGKTDAEAYCIKWLTRAIQARAPHRLDALNKWQEKRLAYVADVNAKATHVFEERVQLYQTELRMNLNRAVMDARFDVIAWFNGGKRNTRPAY